MQKFVLQVGGGLILFLTVVMTFQYGCPRFTSWQAKHIVDIAKAEQQARQIQEVRKPPTENTVSVGSRWSKDLYAGVKYNQTVQLTPIASPGVRMLALLNETEVVEWTTLGKQTNVWDCATLRFMVDGRHHDPGTSVEIRITLVE